MFYTGEHVTAALQPEAKYFATHGGCDGVILDFIPETGEYYVGFGPGLASLWLPKASLSRAEPVKKEETKLKYTLELSEREYAQLLQMTLRCGTGSIDEGFSFPPSFFIAVTNAKRTEIAKN